MSTSKPIAASGIVMLVNAALFFMGAVEHAGIALGPLHEPVIMPATIVESLCGVALLGGAWLLLRDATHWKPALWGNVVAMCGVVLGMIALAGGREPRTESNDILHRVMLTLAALSLALLFTGRRKTEAASMGN